MIRKPLVWLALIVLLLASVSAYRIFYDDTSGLGRYGVFNVTWVNTTNLCVGSDCLSDWDQVNGSSSSVNLNSYWNTSNFTSTDISNWDTAYAWGDHGAVGYFDNIANFTGTLTDTKYCTYNSGTGELDCNSEGGAALSIPAINCSSGNYRMSGFSNNLSEIYCQDINQSLLNTSSLNNDGFDNGLTVSNNGDVLILNQLGGSSNNFFSFQSSGTEVAYMDGLRVGMPKGTAAAPGYTGFSSPSGYWTSTGMWFPSSSSIGFSTSGTNRLTISDSLIDSEVPINSGNFTIDGSGWVSGNSSCIILSSPSGGTTWNICD